MIRINNSVDGVEVVSYDSLYYGKKLKFTPINRNDGLDYNEEGSFMVNGKGSRMNGLPSILSFDKDELVLADTDNSIIRLDPRGYKVSIVPMRVKFNQTDFRGIRYYTILTENGHGGEVGVLDNTDVCYLSNKYGHFNDSNKIVLNDINGRSVRGYSLIMSDRDLLRCAGYILEGLGGDEIKEEKTVDE